MSDLRIPVEMGTAIVPLLRRALASETDYRLLRDAGDALAEIERQISAPPDDDCDCDCDEDC